MPSTTRYADDQLAERLEAIKDQLAERIAAVDDQAEVYRKQPEHRLPVLVRVG
jgi:hypothetical protein